MSAVAAAHGGFLLLLLLFSLRDNTHRQTGREGARKEGTDGRSLLKCQTLHDPLPPLLPS